MKIVNVWSSLEREQLGEGAAWSRLFLPGAGGRTNLVGAGVGSGTSDFPSRSRQKKWRLRNTERKMTQSLIKRFYLNYIDFYLYSYLKTRQVRMQNNLWPTRLCYLLLCPFAVYFVHYRVRLFFTISCIFFLSGTIK